MSENIAQREGLSNRKGRVIIANSIFEDDSIDETTLSVLFGSFFPVGITSDTLNKARIYVGYSQYFDPVDEVIGEIPVYVAQFIEDEYGIIQLKGFKIADMMKPFAIEDYEEPGVWSTLRQMKKEYAK